MNRRTFVAATGATLASIGLAGCTGGNGADESENVTDDGGADSGAGGNGGDTNDDFDLWSIDGDLGESVSEHVTVDSHMTFQTAENVGVTGVIKNTSGQALDHVEVEVTLNDGDTLIGEFVDTNDEEVEYLGAGKEWRFWVTFDDEELTEQTSYTIEVDAEVADDTGTGAENGTATGNGTTTGNGTATSN